MRLYSGGLSQPVKGGLYCKSKLRFLPFVRLQKVKFSDVHIKVATVPTRICKFRPLFTMSCEFCKDGNCCQKETTSSMADAFGFEDPSQLADPGSTNAVAKPPIETKETRDCFDDAKGACCRMSDHVPNFLFEITNNRVPGNVWTISSRGT